MYWIFIAVVFILVGIVIWCFLSFHNVLANRRFLNAGWGRIHGLLMGRNELLAHFQENWAPANKKPSLGAVEVTSTEPESEDSPYVVAFQDLLAEDAAHEWDDVPTRAEIRVELEDAARNLFNDTLAKPDILKDGDFNLLRNALEENTKALNVEVKNFNKVVARYNLLLLQTPNTFMARHFGAAPIDKFPVEFTAF